jgi:heptosyltransferase-2
MKTENQKILIRVPNWIGDAVVSTAFVAACAQTHPGASLSVLAHRSVAPLFENNPNLSQLITLDPDRSLWQAARELRSHRFDAAYILPISFSSALIAFLARIPRRIGYSAESRGFLLTESHQYDQKDFRSRHILLGFLKLLGVGKPGTAPEIFLLPGEMKWAQEFHDCRKVSAGKLTGFGPGATYGPAKRWPAENWVRLGREIASKGSKILVFGSADEVELCREIVKNIGSGAVNLAGSLTLRQSAALISRCERFITNDTGVMHLAAAMGTLVTAIFGSTNPDWTRPWGERHHVIYSREPCSPCYRRECRFGHYNCLKKLTVNPDE